VPGLRRCQQRLLVLARAEGSKVVGLHNRAVLLLDEDLHRCAVVLELELDLELLPGLDLGGHLDVRQWIGERRREGLVRTIKRAIGTARHDSVVVTRTRCQARDAGRDRLCLWDIAVRTRRGDSGWA